MAEQTTTQPAKTDANPSKPLWLTLAIVGGCLAALIVPYLHVRFGSATFPRAATVAVANIGIFLATYAFFRRMLMPNSSSFVGFIVSLLVALPVFIIAFFGLGYEIPEMFDFGLMYVIGSWVGSSEAAEFLHPAQAEEA